MLDSFDMTAIPDLPEIRERYLALREAVAAAEERAGRAPGSVTIELAAKYQAPERVAAALEAGATLLGHNIIQQLTASESALAEMAQSETARSALTPAERATPGAGTLRHRTHVIGHVQSNKAAKAIAFAQCIETLDSFELAERLNRLQGGRREAAGTADPGPFDVFLQVNSSGAPQQFGVAPEAAPELAGRIAELENLRLAGLMTIGTHTADVREIARSFQVVRELRDSLVAAGLRSVADLSMGMTGDMEIAIAEGSTIVRVGTAVFGPRPRA